MKTINYFISVCILLLRFFYSIIRLVITENLVDYTKIMRKNIDKNNDECVLFANGPSLVEVLKDLNIEDFRNKDFGFVNYLATEPCFIILKPKFYVLSDEQFFIDNHPLSEKAKFMLKTMDRNTSWPMLLLIPYCFYKTGKIQTLISNKNIKIIPFHHYAILGPIRLRFKFYAMGLGNGEFGTVIQNAIYCSINMGYKKIHLYGVDHNFFDNLVLDDNNILCQNYTHFYLNNGDKKINLKKITYVDGTPKMVHQFLFEYAQLFYGHHFLNKYAQYRGVEILNHTKTTLIDAYKRIL